MPLVVLFYEAHFLDADNDEQRHGDVPAQTEEGAHAGHDAVLFGDGAQVGQGALATVQAQVEQGQAQFEQETEQEVTELKLVVHYVVCGGY